MCLASLYQVRRLLLEAVSQFSKGTWPFREPPRFINPTQAAGPCTIGAYPALDRLAGAIVTSCTSKVRPRHSRLYLVRKTCNISDK